MKEWLSDCSSNEWSRALVGGKAFHLAEMTRWGFNVPVFGVVTTSGYRAWLKNGTLSDATVEEIRSTISTWDAQYYAVRSSMTLEDGDTASFAGILESYLFIESDKILEKITECFQSIHSERARMYLRSKNLENSPHIGVAVVVQKMIDSKCSGVAFSRSPKLNSSLVYIEAGLGLGEGVVSGLVEVDSYWIDRFGNVRKSEIREKTSQVLYDPSTKKVSTHILPKSNESCLDTKTQLKLSQTCLEIENHFSKASDIEWVVDKHGELFILQARAITQEFEKIEFYSDTNLSESYPDTVSPLTATFIPKVYTKVITEGIRYLGASEKNLKKLAPSLETLIRSFEGHLYYRLPSYYTMLAFLPGGTKNLAAWHRMIGGDTGEKLSFEWIKPSRIEALKMKWCLLKLMLFHHRIFNHFIDSSFNSLNSFESEISTKKTSKESAAFIDDCMNRVKNWGLTILNDFIVIIGLKALDHFSNRYKLPPQSVPQLLMSKKGVDSLKALTSMKELAQTIYTQSDVALLRQITADLSDESNYENLNQQLKDKKLSPVVEWVNQYLDTYGDRSFDELKLECMTFKQSPKEFFKVLHWYLNNVEKNISLASQNISSDSEMETLKTADILKDIPFFPKLALRFSIHITKNAVAARESTRLMRGRYYGLIRSAVLKTSDLLKSERKDLFGHLTKIDFFSLTLEDFKLYSQNKLSPEDLEKTIATRKNWNQKKIEYPEFFCHSDQDKTPYFLIENQNTVPAFQKNTDGMLTGMGASNGKVSGPALVLKDPRDALQCSDLHNRILITQSTDPAWIFVMSQCRGLVSEKGSLLSHTAIVGRELKIPTVVGVKDVTKIISSGTNVEIDGDAGWIKINN